MLVHPTPGASRLGQAARITAVAARLDTEIDRIWKGDFPPEHIAAFAPSWAGDPAYRE